MSLPNLVNASASLVVFFFPLELCQTDSQMFTEQHYDDRTEHRTNCRS
jgi:hypothetical protein